MCLFHLNAAIFERKSLTISFVACAHENNSHKQLLQGEENSLIMSMGVTRKSGPLSSQSNCLYYCCYLINVHATAVIITTYYSSW